MQYNKARENK